MKLIPVFLIFLLNSTSAHAKLVEFAVTIQITDIFVASPHPIIPSVGTTATLYFEIDENTPHSGVGSYNGAVTNIDFSDLGFGGNYQLFQEFSTVQLLDGGLTNDFLDLSLTMGPEFNKNNQLQLNSFSMGLQDSSAEAFSRISPLSINGDLSAGVNYNLFDEGIIFLSYVGIADGVTGVNSQAQVLSITIVPIPNTAFLFFTSLGFISIFKKNRNI